MRNLIGGKHEINQHKWILTLVRNPKTDHSFLVIEGLDANNQPILLEAHLGHKRIDEFNFNTNKCDIYYMNTTIEKLKKISSDFLYKSWEITPTEAEQLQNKIISDQQKAATGAGIDYLKFIQTEGGVGGIIGDSLDTFGSEESKDKSLEKLSNSLNQSSFFSGNTQNVIKTLLNNHIEKENCTSWAIKTVKHIRPEYDEGGLAKYVIVIPDNILPDTKTEKPKSCRIM